MVVTVSGSVTPAIDVYAFGMCALEMASLEIQGNGDSGTLVTQDDINRTIEESLDDPLQKDLIYRCLTADFERRPSARTLLFHPVLFEVHSLKLLAAHALVKTGKPPRLKPVRTLERPGERSRGEGGDFFIDSECGEESQRFYLT